MKFLHVLETLSPRYGGPVSMLLALAVAQQGAGLQLILIPKLIIRMTSITHNSTHASPVRE